MDELIGFLLARIAEDKEKARAAQERSSYGFAATAFDEALELAEGEGAREPAIAHILSWDPPRVLAELEATRFVVEYFGTLTDSVWNREMARVILRQLALPHADHKDYQQGWQP